MKILLTGATGFIGSYLKKSLLSGDHDLIILTRIKRESTGKIKYIRWDWQNPGDLTDLVSQVDVVINLAGESIAKEGWSRRQKK